MKSIEFRSKLSSAMTRGVFLSAAFLLIVISPSHAQTSLGLMVHWKFDEGSGTIASDSSGNGHTGTLVNDPIWVAGQVGNALSFDGINDHVDSTYTDGLTNLTLSVWINPNAAIAHDAKIIFKGGELSLAVDIVSNRIGYLHQFGSRAGIWQSPAGSLSFGGWQHLVVTHDAASPANDPIIYINGAAQTTTRVIAPLGDALYSATSYRTAFGCEAYFNGLIDEVRIYNRVLPASDVQAIYSLEGPPDTTPPAVSITSPPENSTVSGTISVDADASDDRGVAGVQFMLDGNNLDVEDTSAPYSISWNTTLDPDGHHVLTAVARDAAGNSTTSSAVDVTVINSNPPGKIVGICASGGLEVYAIDIANGWAKVRCTPAPPNIPSDANGFALNWRDAATIGPDGLTYATFLITGEEMGGEIRFNDSLSYEAVVVAHGGGGGIQFGGEAQRDGGPTDSTDWQDLQDTYGMRVVGVRWLDTGIDYRGGGNSPAGRFTRNSSAGSTLGNMLERPKLLLEWIHDHLNPGEKPLGMIGSSGGADVSLATQVLQSRIKEKIAYLGPVSYPNPFFDPLNTCNGTTPPGTFVTPATGDLGNSGVGVKKGSGKSVVDPVLRTPNNDCANGTMTAELAAGSSSKDSLQAILDNGGNGYSGTLHILVGTDAVHDSDIANGVVWSAGNLMHHPFFANATRVWFESTTEGHGDPLTNVSGPGFTQVYNELIMALVVGSPMSPR